MTSSSKKRRRDSSYDSDEPSRKRSSRRYDDKHYDRERSSRRRDRDRDRDRDYDRDRRHRDRERDRDRDKEKDRDRERDRDRKRDRKEKPRDDHKEKDSKSDRHKSSKEAEKNREHKEKREESKERTTKEKDKEKEIDEEKPETSPVHEPTPEEIEREKKKLEEERKQADEMQKRKERIAAWKEQVLKKKIEEKEQIEKQLQEKEANRKKWSLDDDEADENEETNPNHSQQTQNTNKEPQDAMEIEQENDEDPLEAFMSNLVSTAPPVIEKPKVNDRESKSKTKIATKKSKLRGEIYFDDEEEEFEIEDEEEEWKQKIRRRELQRVDHSKIDYMPIRKDFYLEVPEISKLTPEQVKEYRISLDNIQIRGKNCPRPIKGFHQCGLSDKLLETLKKFNYVNPTPIQAQAIPTIMSGRDVIGIAKTGSGKTLAFVLPMLRHILDQPLPGPGEGPIGIIMAPTRELAVQIHSELRKFCKRVGIKSVCIFGGAGISHQIGDLKRGAAVAVCTPGRMIDILCTNAGRVTNLQRVSFVVLDEADRMFDMGFEPQIMRIIDNIRPDRQTVMFSATFPRQVETAARKILKRPVEIVVGGVSVVCSDVEQVIEVREASSKYQRLLQLLGEWFGKGSILIFVNQQDDCDNIFRKLIQSGYQCCSLHGGKDQMDRASTISDFKSASIPIMVATSVAARGLDVPSLVLVINYDSPNHYEDYVHRCGRTGRAGRKGTAVTFITPEEEAYSPDLVKALKLAKVDIPESLADLFDKFTQNLDRGQAIQHGSGFGGSGYKFDEAEEQEKRAKEKLQRRIYLGDEEEEDEPVEEPEDVITPTQPAPQKPSVQPTPTPTTSTIAPGVAVDASLIVDKLNQTLAPHKHKVSGAEVRETETGHYEAEVEINDYPQQARWKVTHKDALLPITEFTGCAITTRGTYVPPGRAPQPGERKIYLYIEGPDRSSVNQAKLEIKRMINEAAASAYPDREQYGKYTI